MCHFFLRDVSTNDRYAELANTNLIEEADHWKWFLADLTTLGLDPTLTLTQALRFIWSDATRKTRLLTYELCKLSANLNSLEKLVLILVIEAAGKVALEVSTPVGREASAKLGRNLVYFGGLHLESEEGHTLAEGGVRRALAEVNLDAESRHRAISLVNTVYALFDGQLEDAMDFARAQGGAVAATMDRRSTDLA